MVLPGTLWLSLALFVSASYSLRGGANRGTLSYPQKESDAFGHWHSLFPLTPTSWSSPSTLPKHRPVQHMSQFLSQGLLQIAKDYSEDELVVSRKAAAQTAKEKAKAGVLTADDVLQINLREITSTLLGKDGEGIALTTYDGVEPWNGGACVVLSSCRGPPWLVTIRSATGAVLQRRS